MNEKKNTSIFTVQNGTNNQHSDNDCQSGNSASGSSLSSSGKSTMKRISTKDRLNYRSLIDRINDLILNGEHWFSLEFFPPRTSIGAYNLMARFERMIQGKPLFCDITWHPKGNPGGDDDTSSMIIASSMLNYAGSDTMLHMTCLHQTRETLLNYLKKAKQLGIRNILALRGDPDDNDIDWKLQENGFNFAIDLVKLIREVYGNYFVICVAGYPNGYADCESYEMSLKYTKDKVDAGADFIITQLFFDADDFIKYYHDCRKIGINCPIIPGIMPIQAYDSLRHIVKLSRLQIPQKLLDSIESIKHDDVQIREMGINHCVKMCRKLMLSGVVHGLHFYTLNREVSTLRILKILSMWTEKPTRPLPWKQSANHSRLNEQIRPIHWSNRPRAYIYRTSEWDEFPNGRWGNSNAATFGELKDYHLFYLTSQLSNCRDKRRKMWGENPCSEKDIRQIFAAYVNGLENSNGNKVTHLPWCEDELALETNILRPQLTEANLNGFLTINSQPAVNGKSSTDPIVGWGRSGGYVYQKTYLEFFVSKRLVNSLRKILDKRSDINYHIMNHDGSEDYCNGDTDGSIAVTWGVFPGSEIIQPTVVDSEAFRIWKNEAFSIWKEKWQSLYDEDSLSYQLIDRVYTTFYLVNLVDNEFMREQSTIWDVLKETVHLSNSHWEKSGE
ncbi:hypothetical protein SNEBB_004374 [Seison nebaliae]|nr:hypothetical protein SNEBB_004374 [Seison nebaliae]